MDNEQLQPGPDDGNQHYENEEGQEEQEQYLEQEQ